MLGLKVPLQSQFFHEIQLFQNLDFCIRDQELEGQYAEGDS